MFFFEHSEHCFTFFVFEDDDVVVVLCPNIRQLRTISKEKSKKFNCFCYSSKCSSRESLLQASELPGGSNFKLKNECLPRDYHFNLVFKM